MNYCSATIDYYEQCNSVNWLARDGILLDPEEANEVWLLDVYSKDSIAYVEMSGFVEFGHSARGSNYVTPTLNLNTNVLIDDVGDGSMANPYRIAV